jgi:hybrid cluster-associated redox disulfide protein
MENPEIFPTTCLAYLFEQYPPAIQVFLKHQMACIGCGMASFESVEDAAHIYGIKADILLTEILVIIRPASGYAKSP